MERRIHADSIECMNLGLNRVSKSIYSKTRTVKVVCCLGQKVLNSHIAKSGTLSDWKGSKIKEIKIELLKMGILSHSIRVALLSWLIE